jgi:hypothetical protein
MRNHRPPHVRTALDVMRPSDAFAVSPSSRLDDPARWLRPTLLVLALLAALAVLLAATSRATGALAAPHAAILTP